jgi:hypothetical protein
LQMGSVLLMDETGEPGKNHRPAAGHWQTFLLNVVSCTLPLNLKYTTEFLGGL